MLLIDFTIALIAIPDSLIKPLYQFLILLSQLDIIKFFNGVLRSVRFHQTGIYKYLLAIHQSGFHCLPYHPVKQLLNPAELDKSLR